MTTEYYAPKARAEAEAVEAVLWSILKVATLPDGQLRFADNTRCWAVPIEHPQTGKFGVILPEDWRDFTAELAELGVVIAEVDIQTHDEMVDARWFGTEDK